MIFGLLLAVGALQSHAQSERILQNVYSRQHTMLNGVWQTIVDQIETGFYDYRMNETTNGFFRDYKPTDNYEHAEYDFCDAETLNVPGDWNTQRQPGWAGCKNAAKNRYYAKQK